MSTHSLKLHGGSKDGASILAPVRALGRFERRSVRRRGQAVRGRTTPSNPPNQDAPLDVKPVYWVGDERDTTQGDW